jgi:hypothetical protein
MKKADIEKAAQSHCDSVAIFSNREGGYYRLATSEEQKAERESRPIWERQNTKQKVLLVQVRKMKADGSTAAYGDPVTGFADLHHNDGSLAIWWHPLSRIIECVNETQTFADYMAAEQAAAIKRREQQDAQEAVRRAEMQRTENLRYDLTKRITQMLGEESVGIGLWVSERGEVDIHIDTLAALVERAEKAGA